MKMARAGDYASSSATDGASDLSPGHKRLAQEIRQYKVDTEEENIDEVGCFSACVGRFSFLMFIYSARIMEFLLLPLPRCCLKYQY